MMRNHLCVLFLCCVLFACNTEQEKVEKTVNPSEKGEKQLSHDNSSNSLAYSIPEETDTLGAKEQESKLDTSVNEEGLITLTQVLRDSLILHHDKVEHIDWFHFRNGNPINHAELPQSKDYNSRVWLTKLFNLFGINDYLTGEELALYYKHNDGVSHIIRPVISSFCKKNISRVVRQDNLLIIRTQQAEGIHTNLKIPFLVSFSVYVKNGASIRFGKTFTSEEPLFDGWNMLPIRLNGIQIVQNGDTIADEGYLYNNAYFVNYPDSQRNYKFKK